MYNSLLYIYIFGIIHIYIYINSLFPIGFPTEQPLTRQGLCCPRLAAGIATAAAPVDRKGRLEGRVLEDCSYIYSRL